MCLSKTTIKKIKDKLLTRKKIFATSITDKGLVFRNQLLKDKKLKTGKKHKQLFHTSIIKEM